MASAAESIGGAPGGARAGAVPSWGRLAPAPAAGRACRHMIPITDKMLSERRQHKIELCHLQLQQQQ